MTVKPTVQAPTSASPPPPPPRRPPPAADGLGAVVASGLQSLADLRRPGTDVTSGDLARALHDAVAHHERRVAVSAGRDRLDRVAISVRIAGAHLDAGDLVEARLALDGARSALPHHSRRTADATHSEASACPEEDASAVSAAQLRSLRVSVVVSQAVGVLAAHSGADPNEARTALHEHAERRRIVLGALADDVVAGRVTPSAIIGSTRRARSARPHRAG